MITIICGLPGAGKTTEEVKILVHKMLYESFEDYTNCKREIMQLRAGGFNQLELPPQRHLCFADFRVKVNKRLQAYWVDGFKIGLPNPYFETMLFPPYSTIFLDEAQRYYDSRMSKYLREEVYRWFQLHRQNHYNVYMCCQRLGNIDVNIRALAEHIIVVESLDVKKDDYGRACKLTIKYREFNSPDTAESYQLAKEKKEISKLGTDKVDISTLPIFDYFDSYGCKPAFYDGCYNKGFDYYTEDGYQFTLDSFVEYNNAHYFTAPRGYWKNAEYDKKILARLGENYAN